MNLMPAMFILWAALAACFLALLAYRTTITRYEDDQLFLAGNNENEHRSQDEIVRKINKMQPLVRLFGGAAGLMTAGIVGVYMWDAWQRLMQ